MTVAPPLRCSTLADDLAEPMIGSVDTYARWLLVEDRSAWGEKAVRDVLGADFEAGAKKSGVRPLLVRAHQTDAAARAILVDVTTRQMAVRPIASPASLVLSEVVGPLGDFGASMSGPVFLVCTNGRRDACCALRGRLLAAALDAAQPERTWECSHIGGHRFAANLVCLPDGIVYGRVAPPDAPRLASAYLEGRLDPALLRGRSGWPASAQVAEQALRVALGLGGLDDVELRSVIEEPDVAVVELTAGGAVHRYRLVAERLAPPRAVSCRADELEEPLHWRVVG